MKTETVVRFVVVAGFVALVELLCRTGAIPAAVLVPPSAMVTHGIEMLRGGKFDRDIVTSLLDIVAASVVSVLLGFALGLVLHALPSVRRPLEPLLASYYAVPTFIFYPVFIVLLGVGSLPIIAIAVMLAVVTMITATLNGLDRIPRALHKSAQVMRLSPWRSAIHIKLPATLPYLFTGVKLSVAYAFIGVIASEFILSGSGIGYAIGYAYNNFQNDDMYSLMLFVLVLVTLVNVVLNRIDHRFQARRQQ
ncbi:ABC transporter permease [Paraburkholderia megapolitana]|uniref:NitT/TauT family transport system permease protein n=1 Tax=Paraburkholderia megapolitana TaxID=420953 RepID=A0A1I3W630_9BURK|nr:ABC transporter permease [Paraburkholderia megapolitana]QDQ84635.1 ABC transporter permease [Paraburkholderia megapolitana]SFK02749.1 NitT/TauT family transport system permease protein [Paraburkholderia megapolitana]